MQAEKEARSHDHGNGAHGGMMVDTGHGWVEISVFETNVPPRFRLYFYDVKKSPVDERSDSVITLETIRLNGAKEYFEFVIKEGYWEAKNYLPEPHEFQAVLEIKHGDHSHAYKVNFVEHHHAGAELEFGDAHERAHAMELQKQLTDRRVTTGQVIMFGLTGGLLPCPSAFAVLLVCLQLKKVTLGFAMVLAFSIGLAITLVTVGTIAAISVNHASKRFKGFGEFARKLPYASSTVLIIIGLLVAVQGVRQIFFGS
jgi:nickel/cobalt exporter